MPKVVSVRFNEYYSNFISKELLESFLLDSTCDSPGILKLKLKPGYNLEQEGPYLLPPIRWLDSFEYNAEFDITCDVL
uniref:Uncharacterized protein n=1 Tax=Pichia etchellsii TaxID=28550 RepID=Q9HFH3_PICET|nr:hypothetical protein [Schwanniomyces etchellsii]